MDGKMNFEFPSDDDMRTAQKEYLESLWQESLIAAIVSGKNATHAYATASAVLEDYPSQVYSRNVTIARILDNNN